MTRSICISKEHLATPSSVPHAVVPWLETQVGSNMLRDSCSDCMNKLANYDLQDVNQTAWRESALGGAQVQSRRQEKPS